MKKILCLVLSVCFLCGLAAVPVAAAEGDLSDYADITGLSDEFGWSGYSTNGGAVEKYTSIHDFAYLESTRPGTTYFLPLTRDDFEWEEDRGAPITMRTVNELGITLNLDYTRGNELFDTIKITEQNGQVGILIDFADIMLSVDKEEFEVDAQLLIDGTAYKGSAFSVRGTLANRGMPVYTYDTKCTLGVGRYAVGYDNVRGVKFNLGEGVSITADIEFTDKFYGAAIARKGEIDQPALEQYPQIEKVIQVYTIGLKGKVRIETEHTYYVYDDTLVYLGTTDQEVVYRGKYYLATSKLA